MFRTVELISPAYADLQRQLHNGPKDYGERGDKWAGIVMQVALKYQCSSLLDYGCGQGSLARILRAHPVNLRISEYDPAIPGKDGMPEFADLVNVTDVLEHIEPKHLDTVLSHIRGLARKVVFCVVATKSSAHRLADGRNAHLTIENGAWWQSRILNAGFTLKPPPTVVRRNTKEWVGVLIP